MLLEGEKCNTFRFLFLIPASFVRYNHKSLFLGRVPQAGQRLSRPFSNKMNLLKCFLQTGHSTLLPAYVIEKRFRKAGSAAYNKLSGSNRFVNFFNDE